MNCLPKLRDKALTFRKAVLGFLSIVLVMMLIIYSSTVQMVSAKEISTQSSTICEDYLYVNNPYIVKLTYSYIFMSPVMCIIVAALTLIIYLINKRKK